MRSLHFQRVLGSGAFGTVYFAELLGSRGIRRQVAVKVLLEKQSEGGMFLTRVRDEARLLGLLQDDSILKVLELIRIEGREAVVMEYVEGVDLGELGTGHPPPPRALAELGAAVAGALHRAHTSVHPGSLQPLNVIHRDVKPANIMVTIRGGVKLLDFGVARAKFEARESKTGQFVLGTLNYMAPEYIVTGEVSPKADIYGLALTLWEVICAEVYGQPRLKADQHEARLNERMARIPPQYRALEPIFRQMLHWNPTQRPDALTVERQLHAATDALTGAGLRSWASDVVGPTLSRRPPAQDSIGFCGKVISIADESSESSVENLSTSSRPELPPAPPSLPPTPPPVSPETRPPSKKKPKPMDWRVLVIQAVLLGGVFGILLLLLLTALLFLRNVL